MKTLSSQPQEVLAPPGPPSQSRVPPPSPGPQAPSLDSNRERNEWRLQLWPPGGGRWPGPGRRGTRTAAACAGVAGRLAIPHLPGDLTAIRRAPDTPESGRPGHPLFHRPRVLTRSPAPTPRTATSSWSPRPALPFQCLGSRRRPAS